MEQKPITYLETLTGYTVLDRPLWFHTAGLSTGYGRKLRSRYCVQTDDGRVRVSRLSRLE